MIRLTDWVKRTETEFVLLLPAKVYPCADVMQISRFCVKSDTSSVDGCSEYTTSVRPAEKKDRRKDNMSTNSFTEHKDTKNNSLREQP